MDTMIACKCGCGTEMERYDSRGRERQYFWGHYGTRPRKVRLCSCGCKQTFMAKDTSKQVYIKGHHNPLVGFKKGYTPWNKGKKWTPPNVKQFEEAGKKTRFKKGQLAKEKHPMWKGGITSVNNLLRGSEKYRKWRVSVFKRDNYTCVLCSKRGGDLVADHVKAWAYYPELRFVIDNGRTLCADCNYESTYKLKEWREPQRVRIVS